MPTESLPSILSVDHVKDGIGQKSVRFIKPTLGEEIIPIHDAPTNNSPGSTLLSLRILHLKEKMVIPVHVHRHKEKVYLRYSSNSRGEIHGTIMVFVWVNGVVNTYLLRESTERLVIPPNHPHALACVCTEVHQPDCSLLVISSSKDAADIEWEQETDELLKNAHLSQPQE